MKFQLRPVSSGKLAQKCCNFSDLENTYVCTRALTNTYIFLYLYLYTHKLTMLRTQT